METGNVIAILSLAFGLGMLHALDADHVMAVSGLASTRPGLRTSLAFCARWAVGHGLTLVAIGGAVLLFGMAIPTHLSALAENLVGVVLIGIGVWVLFDLLRRRAHLHFHAHDGLHKHAHWHEHQRHTAHGRESHRHDHSAVMVGMLHGTAGSAPLLALIPLARVGSAWVGMAYLGLFSLGVITAMVLFGGVLGGLYTWLSRWGARATYVVRGMVAVSSIGFGAYLLQGAL